MGKRRLTLYCAVQHKGINMQALNLEQWKNTIDHIQKPVQEIVELNAKTIKKFSYPKLEEFAHLQKPEDIVAKNIDILLANGHRTLNYIEQALNIYEKHFLSLSDEIRESTELAINQTKSAFRENIKNNSGL